VVKGEATPSGDVGTRRQTGEPGPVKMEINEPMSVRVKMEDQLSVQKKKRLVGRAGYVVATDRCPTHQRELNKKR